MKIDIVLSDKEYELLNQWYHSSDNYKSGDKESLNLIVKLDQAFMKEKEWHDKHKSKDSFTYDICRHARKLSW